MVPIGSFPLDVSGSGSEGLVATPKAVFTATRGSMSYVYRVDRSTGKTTTAATVNDYLNSLVGNSTDLFWGVGNTIYRMSNQGGPPSPVHTFGSGDDCYSVAVDETHAYCDINQSSPNWFGVYQVPLSGGGSPIKLTNPYQLIDVGDMVPHNGKLFWDNIDPPGEIAATPIGGGPIETLASVQNLGGGLLVDNGFVYWGAAGAIDKVPVTGGKVTHLATLQSVGNSSWVAEAEIGGFVYASGVGLVKIDEKSGAVTQLLEGGDPVVSRIATDGTSVICLSDHGAIFKLQSL